MLDPYNTTITTHDRDGVYIPLNWRVNLDKWNSFALVQRKHLSQGREEAENKPEKVSVPRAYAPRFSTKAAIAWGRSMGWKLVDQERYNFKTQRLGDLMLGMDVLMDDGEGLLAIQSAGLSQRKEHWERFEQRGGVETAKRRHIKIIYCEFARHEKIPRVIEVWVPRG